MSNEKEDETETEPVNMARRRLLGMAKYVPPIVIGAISLQQAGCQPCGSCVPTCPPLPPPDPSDPGSQQFDKLDPGT